ncbi:unnamed protein product [Ophioblennius macclurei]
MPNRGRTFVKRKISANDWNSSETRRLIMEDHSTAPSFSNHLLQHRHRPLAAVSLPVFEGAEAGYSPSLVAPDSLELFGGNRDQQPATLYSPSSSSSGTRRGRSGGVDGDSGLGEHLDRECGPAGYFDDSWYGGGEKDAWDDGDHLHGDGNGYGNANVFFRTSCAGEDGLRRRSAAADYDGYPQMVYNREANRANRQTASYGGGQDQCCMNLKVIDRYLGKEEDYASGCVSGDDQVQAAPPEVDGPWQGAGALTSACRPQTSHARRTYTQKLDSFSDAFFSQRKRRGPFVAGGGGGDSSEQMWENGETAGSERSKQSCALSSDLYVPPSSSSSSSSPAHLFLPSFPSPPPSSHFMPSVLSPPPTPLPPPSHSPCKMDSPQCGAGQGAESLGALQFFMPSVHPAGMIWKFPVMSHCYPQSAGDGRSSHGGGDDGGGGSVTAAHDILQSLHPSRALCSSSAPSLHASLHLPSRSLQLTSQRHHQVADYIASQKEKKSPGSLNQSHMQKPASLAYTGIPFPSILHSGGGHTRSRYTPQPLLDPQRPGTGLYCSLAPLRDGEEDEQCRALPHVNVGPDFQADLPPCSEESDWPEVWTPDEDSTCEQLLWKPSDELEDSANLQDQVEKLLSMCSSSCLPGGGSNTELALHCLHYCHGDTMATLNMLLFSQCTPTGDYHYSGCDSWTDTEKSVFSAAMATYGKDFSLIQKTVKTKTVRQCVEFYYLGKKLQDKRKKQEEESSREVELEQQKRATPKCQPVNRQFVPEEVVSMPPLASFFPCKLCGKMFYKIKSRNAHMKIHRQPQEDWSDRRLQHQILAQRFALGHPAGLAPPQNSALVLGDGNGSSDDVHRSVIGGNLASQANAASYNKFTLPNSNVVCGDGSSDSNHRDPMSASPFHQSWGTLGHQTDLAAVYSHPKGKEHAGAGAAGGNESATWQ